MHLRRKRLRATVRSMELQRREWASLAPVIQALLRDIRRGVRHRRWDLIVGEDTSGRIPTLLIAAAVNGWYASRGEPKIPVRFVRGSKSDWDIDHQRDLMGRWRLDAPGGGEARPRALVVSDLVSGEGWTTSQIGRLLGEKGFDFDVAALCFNPDVFEWAFVRGRASRWPKGVRFYHGHWPRTIDQGRARRTVWHRSDLSGLRREPKFSSRGPQVLHDRERRSAALAIRQDIDALRPALVRTLG